MIEWPLILLAGLLGSSHCVGMCGPFALALGTRAPSPTSNLLRQLVYSSGRITTYAFGGALAGYAGLRLTDRWGVWVDVQAWLAILAGVVLVWQGLRSAGILPRLTHMAGTPCLASSFFGAFLAGDALDRVFLAGIMTGFLPCGLVYAFLALAGAAGGLGWGMITMALFGLGTVPLMALTGLGGSLLSYTRRQHLLRLAAWSVILAGGISLWRGVGFLRAEEPASAGCPVCQTASADSFLPSWLVRGERGSP